MGSSTSSSQTGWTGRRRTSTSLRNSRAETPAERISVMRDSPVLAETHLAYRNLGNLRV
jgi:hypothetical protein